MRFLSGTKRRLSLGAILVVVVSVAVMSLGSASPALAITADDCPTARGWGYTQTDVEIAADAARIADGVLEAVPTDVISTPARVAAVAAWAIPQGVLRGFEHSYNIAQACDDADHQQLVKDNLDVKVSTRATQTSVNTLQTLVNQIITKVNTLQTTIVNQGNLDLRLQIESDLSDSLTSSPIALFELPASQGGYLELARSIVAELITKMQATSQPISFAATHLSRGDALVIAKKYKQAYQEFAGAYRDLSR